MSPRKPRRGLKVLIVVVVLLACLGFVADRVAESLAEDRLAKAAATEAARYDVRSADTSVEIGGWGFLPQLAKGDFSHITMTMDKPTIESVAAQDLTVDMNGVHVPREVMTGSGGSVTVDTADLHVQMSPESLTKLARRTTGLDGVTLRIVSGKLQAKVAIQGVDATATVTPQVRNGRIRLVIDEGGETPAEVRDALNALLANGIELPRLPFGATVKRVAVEDQTVALTAAASNLKFRSA